ncbi:hypothetical protein [Curtobacterium pusillum]|uniref:hypothetical protein n=1 Tax=Curtobacterium pusillum TaxID=69373 RepID=UPI0011AA2E3F|nr:hypothetical protein [Curtobacterium pusillum]
MQYSDMVATAAFVAAIGIPVVQGAAGWVRRSSLHVDSTVQPIMRIVMRPGTRSYNGGLEQRYNIQLTAPDRDMRVRLRVEVEGLTDGYDVEGMPPRGRVHLRRGVAHNIDVHVRVGEHTGMDRDRRVRVRASRLLARPIRSAWVTIPRDLRERVLDEQTGEYREVEPDVS